MTRLVGRLDETATLDALVERGSSGAGGALVLWDEPGIGKSALLRRIQQQATGFRRLSYRATCAESELDFAGLHGLLGPAAGHIASLPTPYAAALSCALIESSGAASRLLVGAAVPPCTAAHHHIWARGIGLDCGGGAERGDVWRRGPTEYPSPMSERSRASSAHAG